MSSFDQPPRAISVQNPMSINDLMGGGRDGPPRRLSVGAMPPPAERRSRPHRRRGGAGAGAGGAGDLPPSGARGRSTDADAGGMTDPEEMGYDLILNERKQKKEPVEPEASFHNIDDPDEDDIWGNSAAPPATRSQTDDYIHPRERREYERGTSAGPDLPPTSDRFSAPRRDFGARGGSTPSPPATPYNDSYFDSGAPSGYGAPPPPPMQPNSFFAGDSMSFQERQEKKQRYLEGLDKYRRKGMDVGDFNMNSSFEEVESEYNRHKRAVDVEASIQFSRKMLMACVTGLEYVNKRFDPLGLKLDGWSESVIEDIHNYDDVFERLYDKYHSTTQMGPEFELILMLAGSAFMYHLTNSMFKSAMPGMAEPDAMKNVRRGVMGAMRGAFNGAADGGGMAGGLGGMFGSMGGGGGPPQSRPRQPAPPRRAAGSGGGARAPPPSTRSAARGGGGSQQRREMRGPSGNMDDLLNNLMDREPGDVTDRVLDDIDNILNNPSDDDDAGDTSVQIRAMAGPGGVPGMSPPTIEI